MIISRVYDNSFASLIRVEDRAIALVTANGKTYKVE